MLDLASEVGELAKDVNESTAYGAGPDDTTIPEGELGGALFCVLALADETGHEADDALDTALETYRERLDDSGSAGSSDP